MIEPLKGKIDRNEYRNEQSTILTKTLESRVERIEFGFETVKRETNEFVKLRESFIEYKKDFEKDKKAILKECSDATLKVKAISNSEKMLQTQFTSMAKNFKEIKELMLKDLKDLRDLHARSDDLVL